jgi:CheY-like chemotaxis protein
LPVKPNKVAIFDHGRPIRTLHLSDTERQLLLEQREKDGGDFASDNQRGAQRHRLTHQPNIVIAVCQSDGTLVRYAVIARNLSETGAAFMHGAYLHHGTDCVVTIQSNDGKWANVIGRVARCNHVGGKVHEVGVAFGKPINPARFTLASVGDDRPVEPKPGVRLVGRILYITNDVEQGREFRESVAALGVDVTMVKQLAEAALMIGGRTAFDLVAIDESVAGPDDPSPIEQLAHKGDPIPVLLVGETKSASLPLTDLAERAGYRGVLQRPFLLDQVTDVLLQHLPLADAA